MMHRPRHGGRFALLIALMTVPAAMVINSAPSASAGGTPTTITTTVIDNTTMMPWTNTELVLASGHDTATIAGQGATPASGTVTYNRFGNGTCSGTATPQTVSLNANGTVPNSNSTGTLAAGNYSFQASYTGDANYSASTSTCEPFSVARVASTVATVVFDNANSLAWTNTEQTGASAHDTATIAPPGAPTGTLTYSFFHNGGCAQPAATNQTVIVSTTVPNSISTGALAAGSYSFQALYSGDGTFSASLSMCESLTVAKATSSTTTTVVDDATNAAWNGSEQTGASAHDTASIGQQTGFPASGTVTYSFFADGACSGNPATTQTVTLNANGSVPASASTGALAGGGYAFRAAYGGDVNYTASTGMCEPFTVATAPTTTATSVIDEATSAAWSGSEQTGASAHDSATVNGQRTGFPAGGTVTYSFFTDSACSGTPSTQTVTLNANGTVPNSSSTGALAGGSYAFRASYSGDNSYSTSMSGCEPFRVKTTTTVATTVIDNGNGQPWTNNEVAGASAHDTSSIGGQGATPASGTVTYSFFTNGACSGLPAPQTVTLNANGTVPSSSSTGALAKGSYAYKAGYSGDANYAPSTGTCEAFSAGTATTSVTTTVIDDANGLAWTNNEVAGASAHDTASIGGQGAIAATGTVTYSLFSNAGCTGTAATETVTVSGTGMVPNSGSTGALAAGSYAYQATYSGDGNYDTSTSSCEPFTVKATTTVATTVFDDTTNAAWSGSEKTGASAHDTASVGGQGATPATGMVTYRFYSAGSCAGSPTTSQMVAVNGDGSVPDSTSTGALAAGNYAFRATYSGDGAYTGSTSACETFNVDTAATSVSTTVIDNLTGQPWTNTEIPGSTAHDTASVVQQAGVPAGGTVTYSFFSNGSCKGMPTTQTVTLNANGTVPNSSSTGALAKGTYAYRAAYSGDGSYNTSNGPCEPFSVFTTPTTLTTVVTDDSNGLPWAGTEQTGATAHDTATLTAVGVSTATGTVTYSLFSVMTCAGSPDTMQTVTLNANGSVPNSASTAPLMAGSYGFQASYSGDANFSGSTSLCEPFTVSSAATTVDTTVIDNATGHAWTGAEVPGASAHDTARIGGQQGGIAASGMLTYSFFSNGGCTGGATATQQVTVNADGTVPNSSGTGPLAAGSYAFQAAYSGDSNYGGSTSTCESFTVVPASTTVSTTVIDDTTGLPWAGTEQTGASAHDSAAVGGQQSAFPAGGTVTYSFFNAASCAGTPVTSQTVALDAAGGVPDSNATAPLGGGGHAFRAGYSGDSNYSASMSSCETFTVKKAPTTVTTTVIDEATNAAWTNTEQAPAAAHDTASIGGQLSGFPAAGTLTYGFFNSATCSGAPATTQQVNVAGGVPSSSSTGPLLAGSYAYRAGYSGDANYSAANGPCEALTVHGWQIQPTVDASGATDGVLDNVACPSATLCTATGSYKNTSGVRVTLAERWSGGSWTTQSTPIPAGAPSSLLFDVACPSTTICTAVGNYMKASNGPTVTLAERWTSSGWAIQSTPVPAGAVASALSGVSCPSTSVCFAVGNYIKASNLRVPLAEKWNGTSWAIQSTPAPSGATQSRLTDIACRSASFCVAAGNYVNSSGVTVTLVEKWNGIKWVIQSTPNPSGAKASALGGVSCASTTACTAVGVSVNGSSVTQTLAERWNGTKWVIQATPNPSGATSSVIYGVSCPSTTSCTAVGTYVDSSSVTLTLAEHWDGNSWSIQVTPNPAGAQSSSLFGVSCSSTALCTATWQYKNSSGTIVTLAERYS